jgi:hypothetical protein
MVAMCVGVRAYSTGRLDALAEQTDILWTESGLDSCGAAELKRIAHVPHITALCAQRLPAIIGIPDVDGAAAARSSDVRPTAADAGALCSNSCEALVATGIRGALIRYKSARTHSKQESRTCAKATTCSTHSGQLGRPAPFTTRKHEAHCHGPENVSRARV